MYVKIPKWTDPYNTRNMQRTNELMWHFLLTSKQREYIDNFNISIHGYVARASIRMRRRGAQSLIQFLPLGIPSAGCGRSGQSP